jgi:hypothetical protein
MCKVVEVLQEELKRLDAASGGGGDSGVPTNLSAECGKKVGSSGEVNATNSSGWWDGVSGKGLGGLDNHEGNLGLVKGGVAVQKTPASTIRQGSGAEGAAGDFEPSTLDLQPGGRALNVKLPLAIRPLILGSPGRLMGKTPTTISALGSFDVTGSTFDQQDQAHAEGAAAERSRAAYGRSKMEKCSSSSSASWWKWCGWHLWR